MYNKEQLVITKLNGSRSAWRRQEKLPRHGTKSAAGVSVSAKDQRKPNRSIGLQL
jgi:hypothetical protein